MSPSDGSTGDETPRATPFIHRHPWIIVAAVFLFLMVAWSILILIAGRNRPERVPLEHLDQGDPAPQTSPAD